MGTALQKSSLQHDAIIAMPDGLNYSPTLTRDIKAGKTIRITSRTPFWVTPLSSQTAGYPSLDNRFFQIMAIYPYQSRLYPHSQRVAEAREVVQVDGAWCNAPKPLKILVMEEFIRNAKIMQHYASEADRPAFFTRPAAADHSL